MEVIHDKKRYMDVAGLAELTGYDHLYLRRIAKAGKLDAIQIGASWLINPVDLELYQTARKSRKPHKDKVHT